jgi:HEAT repeats
MDYEKEYSATQEAPRNAGRTPSGVFLRVAAISSALAFAIAFASLRPATARAAWEEFERIIKIRNDPNPALPAQRSDHLSEQLKGLKPQKQAELLAEASINHYDKAIELIGEHADQWRGRLQLTPPLSDLLAAAINSNDLRVRAAAVEIYLAAYKIPKTAAGAALLRHRISLEPEARPWALWMLGAIGNRGVEPEKTLVTLINYIHEPDEMTRFWAVEGLGLLGSDGTIEPLLGVLRDDPSPKVKERAACSLAQSGMLTKGQRMKAVPTLLNYAEDPSFDLTSRLWIFQALSDITGEHHGNDAEAWRKWWNESIRG